MRSIKEKLETAFGSFGLFLFWFIKIAFSVFPFPFIGVPVILSAVFVLLNMFFPPALAIFWILGLICAIKDDTQTALHIIYYIVFAVIWLPVYVNMMISMIKSLK